MTAMTWAAPAPATTGTDRSLLTRLADWLVELMEIIGPVEVGLAVFLENLFPPLPSEAILPLAGVAAGRGLFPLWQALLFSTLGSIAGAYALYWMGRALGRERTRRIFSRLPLVKIEDVDRTEAWFIRHGAKAVFFGRMIPVFRSLISLPAGITTMRQGRFLLLSAAGSALWNTLFVLAGFWLGERWHVVEEISGTVQNVIIAVVISLLTVFVVWRVRTMRREKAAGSGSAAPTNNEGQAL